MKNGLEIDKYGIKHWYKDDLPHRVDGPAIEYANGDKYWWLNGQQIKCSTHQEFEQLIKLKKLI